MSDTKTYIAWFVVAARVTRSKSGGKDVWRGVPGHTEIPIAGVSQQVACEAARSSAMKAGEAFVSEIGSGRVVRKMKAVTGRNPRNGRYERYVAEEMV